MTHHLSTRGSRPSVIAAVLGSALAVATLAGAPQPPVPSHREALTFHASFDGGLNASFALGDPTLYSAPSRAEASRGTPGAPSDAVQLAKGEGRRGDALRIRVKASPFVFFKGERNIAYQPRNWSGTVSVWLRLDPDRDLAPGYSDPLIITPRAWNDAALFIDFTRDDVPRRFRFAAFADRGVWDPAKREWDAVPVAERPMVEVTGPRFARDRWTHIVWTWTRFNTGAADGAFACYLDGEPAGSLSDRLQTYTWDPREVSIALGVQFIGLMDELTIFNRALTPAEVRSIFMS